MRAREKKKKEWMRAAKCWNVLEWGGKRKKRKGDRDKDNVCEGEKEEGKKKRMDEMKWEKGEII